MKLLFAGTPAAALPSLTLLLQDPNHDVVAVLTRPAARSGRGRALHDSPVASLAHAHGIEVLTPTSAADPAFLDRLAAAKIDCAPVVAYGSLLREPALTLPRLGWVNLHFSLLPAWRGAAPVQHAVLHGDEITGASTFQIGPGLDDGPVFGVVTEAIRPRDTSGDLLQRLAQAGAHLLLATLNGIADSTLRPEPQPGHGISHAPKLGPQDGRIDLHLPAIAVDRRIRACTPEPGAWLHFRNERLKVGPIELVREVLADLAPATLLLDSHAVWVGTATAPVQLGWVQPAGRKPMPALDWARGARLTPGERFA